MLAPDPSTTESQLQSAGSTVSPVTEYCQALRTLVSPYQAYVPASAQQVLHQSQQDAKSWSGLCQRYTTGLPTAIVQVGNSYLQASGPLQTAADQLSMDPSDQNALSSLTQALSGVQQTLQEQLDTLHALQQDVVAFEQKIQQDEQQMTEVVNSLSGAALSAAQATLSTQFLQSNVLGPCIAIVSINSQINLQLTTMDAPEVVGVALLQALLSQLITLNGHATQALSAVLDSLSVLNVKYQAVLSDLAQATNDTLPAILQGLELQVSLQAWQQLVDYASGMLTPQQA
ncbi:hypothetical protein [Deinococcus cellulosilyticus]|uniref:Uncharacterized protein n=1 Tax=Deinococcus cellulosilyticus (strain DSM 18568 / NBRC 106333 / KACC 11606 / 5516J-15) TaxID=1223518 RepID=A0A511MZP9_DEIC1|nr:hypothetical protein [Deinococcus cellulosilyticus]GEM45667.1 hypothetical protein DC3_13020 [Deinococcus cellulosilyticus NBRC 106333 = KACC 11606]